MSNISKGDEILIYKTWFKPCGWLLALFVIPANCFFIFETFYFKMEIFFRICAVIWALFIPLFIYVAVKGIRGKEVPEDTVPGFIIPIIVLAVFAFFWLDIALSWHNRNQIFHELKNGNISEKVRATEKLRKIVHHSARSDILDIIVPALIDAIDDSDSSVRKEAVTSLAETECERCKSQDAVDALIRALNDKASKVRLAAASTLGINECLHARDALIKIMQSDSDNEVRKKAEWALERLPKQPPIHPQIIVAASKGDIETVRHLLQKDGIMNADDENGFSAIHHASSNGHENIVAILLSAGVTIDDDTNNEGQTPLHMAVEHNHINVVSLLLSKGASFNLKDSSGNSPLHVAAKNGHKNIAELLISKGVTIDAMNNMNATPLHKAAYYGRKDVVELLLSNGADVNAKTWMGVRASSIVEKIMGDINFRGKKPNTPLNLAINNGHKDVIEVLKKHGAYE
jgi:ankyrin repeat protein